MRGIFVGLATLDLVHRVERLPEKNEKVNAVWQRVSAGGPAANAAKAYAAMGGAATLITALGASKTAKMIRRDLNECGVEVVDVSPETKADPPLASVAVDDETGERAVISLVKVPYQITVPTDLEELLSGSDTVLVDGHHAPLAIAAAQVAKRLGLDVVVDGGRWKPVFSEILPLATVAIVSSDFGLIDRSEKAISADILLSLGLEALAVTQGDRPVRWWQPGGLSGKIQPPVVEVKDTLGAGDVLHGAFCYYRKLLDTFPEQLAAAMAVSTDCCRFFGVQDWVEDVVRRRAAGGVASEATMWNP